MDKPCGCATAEQCFTNCCCHTPAETLAWARRHRVAPHVLAALERRVGAATDAPAGSCCGIEATRPSAKPRCCAAAESGVDHSDAEVCRDYQSLAAEVVPPPAERPAGDPPAPSRSRVVTLRAMLACGGVLSGWLATGVALPPPPIMTCERLLHPCGIVVAPDLPATGVRSAPEAPPPRA